MLWVRNLGCIWEMFSKNSFEKQLGNSFENFKSWELEMFLSLIILSTFGVDVQDTFYFHLRLTASM